MIFGRKDEEEDEVVLSERKYFVLCVCDEKYVCVYVMRKYVCVYVSVKDMNFEKKTTVEILFH